MTKSKISFPYLLSQSILKFNTTTLGDSSIYCIYLVPKNKDAHIITGMLKNWIQLA